jgi:hypothetical protein
MEEMEEDYHVPHAAILGAHAAGVGCGDGDGRVPTIEGWFETVPE